MRKVISSINVTLDGFCDHTVMIADEALHENVNKLFRNSDIAVMGRKTYQLMESSWPAIVEKPTGEKAMDDFAVLMDNITKVVFSHTLKEVSWKNSIIAQESPEQTIKKLKSQPGKDILVGSPSMIIELSNLGLIDEYQFYMQPIILGKGLPLFKNITERKNLKLAEVKKFDSDVLVLIYHPA